MPSRLHPLALGAAGLLALTASLCTTGVLAPHRASADTVASPLLWGENLVLNPGTATSDWFLDSPSLRTALKDAHTQIIRMPVRGPNPDTAGWANKTEFTTAASYVLQLGMTPLVILRNPEAPQALDTDTQVVDYIRGLFGDAPVYYEFGNETDLHDTAGNYVAADSYVAQWNQTIPTLKAHAGAAAKFIGPVSYTYDEAYLSTFLANARPTPDAISWHMYTCGTGEAEPACLNRGGIDDWPGTLAGARALIRATVGTDLPIWITEWNFNPSANIATDPNLQDQSFLRTWTLKALKTLADNGVTASMHFNVQGQVPLARSDGTLTAQGQAFKDQYEALVGSTPSPSTTPTPSQSPTPAPSATTTPTASPSPPTSSAYHVGFEDGAPDGWSGFYGDAAPAVVTDAAFEGTHALRFHRSSSGHSAIGTSTGLNGVHSGSTITYHVLAEQADSSVQPFVRDAQYHSVAAANVALPAHQWTTLTWTVPSVTSVAAIGLDATQGSGTVVVDDLSWPQS